METDQENIDRSREIQRVQVKQRQTEGKYRQTERNRDIQGDPRRQVERKRQRISD